MPGHTNDKAFQHSLLPMLRLDDDAWDFRVPSLLSPSTLRQAGLIKAISLNTDLKSCTHSMIMKLERSNTNRAIHNVPLNHLILLSLEGFRSLVRGAAAKEEAPTPDLRNPTGRGVSDYSIRPLRAGITVQGVYYNFYGHSNSQLK